MPWTRLDMTTDSIFDAAVALLDAGDVGGLKDLLKAHPDLAHARDDGNATLLIRLIDWPGHRPRAAESARALLDAGAEVDARRNDDNGTPLGGSLCTEEVDVIRVLLDHGADIHAACGWQPGTVLDLADDLCQNQDRIDDDEIRGIAEWFTRAAGRKIPSRTPLGGITPLLFVSDVDEGVKFYTEKLGFRVNFEVESETECGKYVSVVRGAAEFHITTCQCDDNGHVGKLSVRISCGPVDALHEEFRNADVRIRREPANQSWGLREFEIEDLVGNRLTFWSRISKDA